MIVYSEAEDVKEMVSEIIKVLNFYWIDLDRLHFVRSFGSKSKAVARCYGFPRIWQFVMREKPRYIIEVISENFDKLSEKEKIKVLIHELLHIPRRFSGGLRSHRYVKEKYVRELLREYLKKSWNNIYDRPR